MVQILYYQRNWYQYCLLLWVLYANQKANLSGQWCSQLPFLTSTANRCSQWVMVMAVILLMSTFYINLLLSLLSFGCYSLSVAHCCQICWAQFVLFTLFFDTQFSFINFILLSLCSHPNLLFVEQLFSLSLFELFSVVVLSNCWDAWSNYILRSFIYIYIYIYSYSEVNTSANTAQLDADVALRLLIAKSSSSLLVGSTLPISKVDSLI